MGEMEHPLVQRLLTFKLDLKEWYAISTAEKFPVHRAQKWINDHFELTIQAAIVYVIVIFGTQFIMRNRRPFNLQLPLNIWNLFLAVFSIIGTYILSAEFFGTISNKGFVNSYCYVYDFLERENGRWVWFFICSKVIELIDTVFIVLRKRPLSFLHWYHHVLTGIYAFYSYPVTPGFNRWGICLNFFVHAFMYSYYFLRSLKIKVPGFVAQFITTIQIWQFIISVGLLIHTAFLIHVQGANVDFDHNTFYLATFMDVTYLILFINFFLQSYVFKGGKDKYKSVEDKKKKKN